MSNRFPLVVAYKTLNLLDERKAILYGGRKAFWVWSLADRVLVIFDPAMVDIGKLNADFAHRLSTRLQGRMVVRTNSRGLFLQVDPNIPAVLELLDKPLNLAEQPSAFHMGIGHTGHGDLWISLIEGDSFFVVGMRGMGKTGELHAMIQSLLHGGQTMVYAWDGKENAEYLRYVGRKNFTLLPMDGLQAGLEVIQAEATLRMRKLAMSGHPNIMSFNAQADPSDYMPPIALFVDEVAEVNDQALLLKQVKVNRAAGVYPIFATNDPSKSAVIAKSNLGTRISFKVVATPDSMMGLGQPGANNLPNICGRGMIVHRGRLVEFQSFTVEYPAPTEEGMKWMVEHLEGRQSSVIGDQSSVVDDEIRARVLKLASDGKSKTAIVYEIWDKSGSNFAERMEQVKSILATASTSTASGTPDLPLNGAVA